MGRLWVPMADRFNAPSACRVSRDGACDERVKNCPNLHMRPFPAAGRADIALVELGRNGIVARCPRPPDLINDLPHIGGKTPRIWLPSGRAAFCNLGEVGIAQALSAPLGGRQSAHSYMLGPNGQANGCG